MTEVVSLPTFGGLEVHVPDLFVIKMKKGYKLISPTTKTGALTSRAGKKAFKIIKNEKNELFLHEHPFPKVYLKDFSKKDQNIMQKYFPQKIAHIAEPGSPTSTLTNRTFNDETDTLLLSGKIKYKVRKSYDEGKKDQKKQRNDMALEDLPRISRLARIAQKKVDGTGLETHHHHIHFV